MKGVVEIGVVEEKEEFLRGLTLFSVPVQYPEAFGLYLVEALASGVPVVQPDASSFPESVAATGGLINQGRLMDCLMHHGAKHCIDGLCKRRTRAAERVKTRRRRNGKNRRRYSSTLASRRGPFARLGTISRTQLRAFNAII